MARKKFTEAEMDKLRSSPYVLEVSPNIVHFSAEFKERFWQMIMARNWESTRKYWERTG